MALVVDRLLRGSAQHISVPKSKMANVLGKGFTIETYDGTFLTI